MKITTNGVVFAIASVLATLYAGTKHAGRVTFPYTDPDARYLTDNGSYVTNGYVHVAFVRSLLVPTSADLLGYVRPASSTNDTDWVQMLETTFAQFACPSNIPWAGAETNEFAFFTTWTPGPAVHTNGVAVVTWQQASDGTTNRFPLIRTGVYANSVKVAPTSALTNGPAFPVSLTLTQGATNE